MLVCLGIGVFTELAIGEPHGTIVMIICWIVGALLIDVQVRSESVIEEETHS